jgi:predicted PurR-regulated permease PerM
MAFILNPFVEWITRFKLCLKYPDVSRSFAILLSFLAVVAFIIGITMALFTPLIKEFNELYINIPQILTGIHGIVVEFQNNVVLPMQKDELYQNQSERFIDFLQQAISSGITFFYHFIRRVANLSINIVSRIVELVVVPVLTFYFVRDWKLIVDWFVNLFAIRSREKVRNILMEMGQIIGDFLQGQFLLCSIIGGCMFIGLYSLNIKYPLVLAILAAITEAIPIIGPILASVPAIILGLTISPLVGLKVALFCFILQQLENHIIVPKVMGDRINLHPTIVIISLLLSGQFFGVLGMMVALPATALLKILMKYFWITEEKI